MSNMVNCKACGKDQRNFFSKHKVITGICVVILLAAIGNLGKDEPKLVKGDEFSKPADGNEFLAIDCTVENISDVEQAISSVMMFKVVENK